MRSGSFLRVPAGKRPKIKKTINFDRYIKSVSKWFRAKKILLTYFALGAALSVLVLLGLYDYLNNYVFVVLLNGREVGVVEDAKEIETFIAD